MPQIRTLGPGLSEEAAVAKMKEGNMLQPKPVEAPDSPAEEARDERPRDESGRFLPRDESEPKRPTDPGDEAEEAEAAEAEPAEDEETEDEALEPIDPPVSWSDAQKEAWAQLPPELQEYISERESEREGHFTKRSQEIAQQRTQYTEAMNAVEAERQHVQQTLQPMIQQLEQVLQTDESSIDAMIDPSSPYYDPENYRAAREQLKYRQEMLRQARQSSEEAEKRATEQRHNLYVQDVLEHERRLVDAFPSWGQDPTKAKAEIEEIRQYLISQDVPKEVVQKMYQAPLIITARKAMMFDRQAETRKRAENKKDRPKPRLAKSKSPKGAEGRKAEGAVAARRNLKAVAGTSQEADAFVNALKSGRKVYSRSNRR